MNFIYSKPSKRAEGAPGAGVWSAGQPPQATIPRNHVQGSSASACTRT